MKTFYYELNEDNQIIWIDEVDRLNAIDPDIVSPTIKLETIEGIESNYDKIVKGKIVKHQFTNEPVVLQPQEELLFIQQWFIENDWIPNKVITGEWEITDERWLNYLNERAEKRARQDKLRGELDG